MEYAFLKSTEKYFLFWHHLCSSRYNDFTIRGNSIIAIRLPGFTEMREFQNEGAPCSSIAPVIECLS